MFENLKNLDLIHFIDINATNISNMNNLFRKCVSLTSIDLTIFDTSKVADMTSMF